MNCFWERSFPRINSCEVIWDSVQVLKHVMRDHRTWQTRYPNDTFRIGYVPLPPYHSAPDENGLVSGTWGRLLTDLIGSLDMRPEWIIPSDGHFGHKNPDGSFTGQWGLVMYNHSDITLGPWPRIEILMEDATPSRTVDYATLDFFTCIPNLLDSTQVSLNLMDRYVAGGMFIAMMISGLVAQLAIRLEYGFWDNSVWWTFIRSLTLEPSVLPRTLRQSATRLVFAVWSLALLVISQGINSDLKTSLILQAPADHIQTLEEIAIDESIVPFTPIVLKPLFLGDQRASMEKIAARAERMNVLINADDLGSTKVFEKIAKRGAVVMMTPEMMESSLASVCPIVDSQYIYRVEESIMEFSLAIYFRPDYSREKQEQINKRIQWIHETPFPWHRAAELRKQISAASSSTCFASSDQFRQTVNEMKPTSVSDISVMIFLYGLAIGLATAALGFELVLYRTRMSVDD